MSYLGELTSAIKYFSEKDNLKKLPKSLPWLFTLVSLFLLIYGTLSFYLGDLVDNWPFKEFSDALVFAFFALLLTYLISWFYSYARTLIIQRNFVLKQESVIKDFYYQGYLNKTNKGFSLSYSDSGCLIRNRSWRDYHMEFDFKLKNDNGQRGFGVIIRAKDLENYIMLKLDDFISPHIRVNKLWEIISPNDCKLSIIDAKWHHIVIDVKMNKATLKIDSSVNYKYNLPTHSGISLSLKEIMSSGEENKKGLAIAGWIDDLRNSGTIGFRCWGAFAQPMTEFVEIKNLVIKKQKTWNSYFPLDRT